MVRMTPLDPDNAAFTVIIVKVYATIEKGKQTNKIYCSSKLNHRSYDWIL